MELLRNEDKKDDFKKDDFFNEFFSQNVHMNKVSSEITYLLFYSDS